MRPTLRRHDLDEVGLCHLAGQMSVMVDRPAILCLEGDLGVGKSAFARAWIRTRCGEIDVPSPTFSLLQDYQTDSGLWLRHGDLYRLNQTRELDEIGFFDDLDARLFLIEWGSRADDLVAALGAPLAWRSLEFAAGDGRNVCLKGEADFWDGIIHTLEEETDAG